MRDTSVFKRFATMDPALLRGLIVSLFGVVAAVLGVTFAPETVENVVTLVLSVTALLAGVLIRPVVTPNAKVLAFKPNPLESNVVLPGEATVGPEQAADVADVAQMKPRAA